MCKRLEEITILVILILAKCIQCACFGIEKCPGTNVSNIRNKTMFNEISLIFYYSQWNDESLDALRQFNDVADYFEGKIYFATIDCWHFECNCSRTLSTTIGSGSPHKWPTLMAHYGRLGQLKIQYSGLFTFRYMQEFVMNIIHPLERIEDREDLENVKSLADRIVLGVFRNPERFEYNHYLTVALKWLEHDPIRSYRFAVTFANVNDYFNKTGVKGNNLYILGLNNTKAFVDYKDFKWNASNIMRWLRVEFNDDYSLLHGYSTPIAIAQKMKKQPVLGVFINEPKQFYSYMENNGNNKKPFEKVILACKSAKKANGKVKIWKETMHISTIMQNILVSKDISKCTYYKYIILKNLKYYYEINQYLQLDHGNSVKSGLDNNPSLEVHELLEFFHSVSCLQENEMNLQSSIHISTVKKLEYYLSKEQAFKSTNRSLSVSLLDTKSYKDFLENLDILPTYKSMATVIIIDNNKENIYLMKDSFSIFSLLEFGKKFYTNGLNNYYKSAEYNPSRSPPTQNCNFEINQINRHIFLNYIQYTHNQTLVLLIFSPDCALCGNLQHTFAQLSIALRYIENLKFIRINAMDNDLPWQFNMPFLPSLLVFPQNRFSESRLFPSHLKPDMRNVFGFILNQLSAHQQLGLVLAMCQSGSLPKIHVQSCWHFAKTILMQHIGKHLQYWQLYESERSLIFERLRAFKVMGLEVQSNLRL